MGSSRNSQLGGSPHLCGATGTYGLILVELVVFHHNHQPAVGQPLFEHKANPLLPNDSGGLWASQDLHHLTEVILVSNLDEEEEETLKMVIATRTYNEITIM